MRSTMLRRLMPAPLSLWLFLAVVLPGTAFAARYEQGQRVQVTGIVTGRDGRPLQGIRVSLEASRSYFSLRQLRKTAADDVRRVSALTNATGEYTLEWPWDSYFNHFELVSGVPVRKGRQDRMEELAREDVTKRLLAGSPVVVSPVIENTKFLDSLNQFLAMVRSADEQRTYEEMGKPDRVKRLQYPDHVEDSWWYFESGRVYRFRDGRLEQVVPFTPVPAPAAAVPGT
ncbi:MAG TPA: carboxypeptidase-like regulatory domain-containing protein [Thermoanaerobaculia bacterium]|nr:carboxypeptidase-like regulatory domain-containing protein [Thermoanaerobaculia bacterium]